MTTVSEVQTFLNILGYKKGGGGSVTFPITLAQGGFGQSNSAALGAIPYSNASTIALSAPSTKLGQYFRSGAAGVPTWSTLTMPDTIGVNNIFLANVANVVTTLGSTNSSMLYTSATGVIGWSNAATVDANGNFVTTAGIVETNSLYLVPVNAFSITLALANHLTSLNPAGTLATGTITMPATPANGQRLKVATTQTITALTVNANTGQTILAPPQTLLAGDSFEYIYNLALTAWYPYEGTGQLLPSATLLGNALGTPGGAVPITLGSGLSFSGNVLNAVGGGGSGTVSNSTVANQLAFYSAPGTTVSPLPQGSFQNSAVVIDSSGNVQFASLTVAGKFVQSGAGGVIGASYISIPNSAASVGDIWYASAANAMQPLAAPASISNAMLWGNTGAPPTYAPYAMPATVTANQLLFVSSSTAIAGLNLGTNLSITGNTLNAAGGGGGLSPTLNSGNIFVGNGSNVATGVAMTGDATVSNTGALTLATVNTNVGTFNTVTVDAKGRVVAATDSSLALNTYVTTMSTPTDVLPTIYNNGTAGVGATLTYASTGAQTLDGQPVTAGNNYLIVDAGGVNNGIYTCTTTPATGVAGVLTRATTYNTPALMNSTGFIVPSAGSQSGARLSLANPVTTIGSNQITYYNYIITNPISTTQTNQLVQYGSNRTFVQPGLIMPNGLTTNSLLYSAGVNTVGQLTLGTGLSISGTTLNASSSSNAQIQVQAATTATQTGTYHFNSAGGVGDTFTYTATGVISYDGQASQLGKDYLFMANGLAANGVWTVTTLGATGIAQVMTRSVLYNTAALVQSNINIKVLTGSTLGNSSFFCVTNSPTMGTTNLVYYPQSGYPAGSVANGILLTGSANGAAQFNVITAPPANTVLTGAGTSSSPVFTTSLNGANAMSKIAPVTGTTTVMTPNNTYVASIASTLTTLQLPGSPNPGAMLVILQNPAVPSSLGWKIVQTGSQVIYFGLQATTTGTSGSLQSTALGDSVIMIALDTLTWVVVGSTGNNITIT